MSVILDIKLAQKLVAQPDSLNQAAESSGFCLYWSHLGYSPDQAIAELRKSQELELAEWGGQEPRGKTPLGALSRLSGNSIKQEVSRHLPLNAMPEIVVEFVPGNVMPLVAEGNIVAVNIFSLQLVLNKLQVQGIPLLSLLTNRIHRLATENLLAKQPGDTGNSYNDFIAEMFREGCATLFFTVPTTGPVYDQWQRAEERREDEFALLRRCIRAADTGLLVAELRRSLALTGDAVLAARYPLATWMCRVVEGAFSRSFLVDLLLRPHYFLKAFEEARIKFGLPNKYSIAV